MGLNVVPALVVFQRPPDAVATYQIFRFVGCTATSLTRPDSRAGPMDRSRSPLTAEARGLRAVSAGAAPGAARCGGRCCTTTATGRMTLTRSTSRGTRLANRGYMALDRKSGV